MAIREALSAGGSTGRIQPANYSPPPPAGDWVYCMGSDKPGIFARIKVGEAWSIEQTDDFGAATVLRLTVRTRAPQVLPRLVKITSVATGTYRVTINGTDHDYAADTTGLLFGSGASATIGAINGSLLTIGGLSGMTAASVGRRLVISGAAEGANNGTFPIETFLDANTVLIRNASAVSPDANSGSVSWEERRRPDNNTTIPLGLRDAIVAGGAAVSCRIHAEGVLQIDEDDIDDNNTFGVTGNLSLHQATWNFQVLIDSTEYASQPITDRGRIRDRVDLGGSLSLLAGNHDLEFRLVAGTAPSLAGLEFEGELPAVYIDEISLT